MGTNYIAPTWRQPENTNKDKLSNYGIDTTSTSGIDCGPMADIFGTSSVTYNTSYSIWIKPEFNYNDAGYQTFFGNFSTGNNALLLYYATDIDAWKFAVGDGNGHNYVSSATITSNEELGKGEWQHHCVVFDTINNDAYYYINNQLVNDGTGGSTGTNLTRKIATNANFYIGKKWDLAAGTFTGQISQGCIFDYALSTEQRTYLYNLNNPIAISGAKPIAYWPLGDNSNPTATAGYPNISVGADSVFDFIASGPDQIVTKKFSDFSISTEFSFSTWVNFDSESSWDHVIGNPSDGSWADGFGLYLNGSGIVFWVGKYNGSDNSGNPTFVASGNTDINPNRWYHITCTYSNSEGGKMYINSNDYGGVQKTFTFSGDASDSTNAPWINTTDITIGTVNNNATYAIDGKVSNVQIWNKKLSDTDTITLWNNGQPLMTGAQPQEANLQGWYKLNQSANWEADTAGNWQIPDAVSEYPQSFNFDNNPYILFSPNFYTVGSNKMQVSTVSWWMNSNRAGSYSVIFAFDSNNSWMLRIDNSGNMWFFSGSGASYVKFNNVTGNSINLCDSKWHHCVFTIPDATDKTQCKFFIDNQEITSTITSGSAGGDGSLVMQQLELAGGYLGNIEGTVVSNVQAWLDIALDSSDVETLYNNGVPLPTNSVQSDKLEGWYKLDNTEIFDGTNWSIENKKYPANYFKAIDTTSRAFRTSTTALSDFMGSSVTNFTWSMWVRNTSGDTGSSSLVSWSYPSSSSYKDSITIHYSNGLALWGSSTSKIYFGTINDGTWKHVLIAVDLTAGTTWDEVAKCFINGQPKAMTSFTGTPPTSMDWTASGSNQRDIGVGVGYTVSHSFHGDISNYTLYNSTLGQTEATALYNNGTPVTTAVGSPTAWWKINNLTTGLEDVSGNSYNIEPWGSTQVEVDTFVSTEAVTSSGMTESNLVNNNVSVLNGESSGMNTTNLVQSNLTRKQPFSNYSIHFDTAGADYIDLGSPSALDFGTGEMTLSCWINLETLSGIKPILGNSNSGITSYQYLLDANRTAAKITFLTSGGPTLTSSLTISANTWYHICLTRSGTTSNWVYTMYINGSSSDGATASTTTNPPATQTIAIGRYGAAGGYYFQGEISNFSAFNTALNQDDVINMYNNGITQDLNNFRVTPVAWYPMDQSYTYFNGSVLVARDVISGNDGTGANVIQENIIGDAPGSIASGTGSNLTIADLKGDMKNSTNNSYSINMADYADGVTNPANSGRSTNVP